MSEFHISIEDDRGTIRIGSFEETFSVDTGHYEATEYVNQWLDALSQLADEGRPVALMTWMSPPETPANRRGWVLYPEEGDVFIQEHLFVHGDHESRLDDRGVVIEIPARETHSEDGERLPEWQTSIFNIQSFIKAAGEEQ